MLSAPHSLRYRFVFALLGVLVLALIALAAFTRFALMPELLRIETLQANEALERAQRAIRNEARHLDTLSKDWATWDDSYQFMRDGNRHFLASNISDAAIFDDADLSLIAFLEPDGTPYRLNGIAPTTGQYHSCALLDTQCQWMHPFLDTARTRIADAKSGAGMTWLQARPQPALVSVQPILRSDGSGPLAGWLAMTRPMSEDWQAKLREGTGLAVTVRQPTATVSSVPDLERVSDAAMRASHLLPAAPPGEQLILEVELPRQRLNMRIEALELGLTWTVSLIIIVVLVVLWLLERIVLNPLRLFAAFTRRVQRPERTDVPERLQQRRDEIGVLARHFQQLIEFHRQQKAGLIELSEHDALTGLANRRRFDEHLATALATDAPMGQSTALVVMDIDHYKDFNDRYGHPAGDACLQSLAKVMGAHFDRTGQLVARTGGEEFMAVLPGTSQEAATACAERLRAAIEALAVPHADQVVTVSVGVSCSTLEHRLDAKRLIEAGDQALYAAKKAGRNRVMTARDLDWA